MFINEILKQRRNELGMTQQEVADKLHVSRQTISNWEMNRNYPDIPTLVSISVLYDLSLDYILKGDVHYMKKVKKDYQLIQKEKNAKWLDRGLIGSFLVMLLPLACIPFIYTDRQENILGVLILFLVFPLLFFSYLKYKTFFAAIDQKEQPLFIPKMYGIGISINPNHPIGKLIWFILILLLVGLLLFTFQQAFF